MKYEVGAKVRLTEAGAEFLRFFDENRRVGDEATIGDYDAQADDYDIIFEDGKRWWARADDGKPHHFEHVDPPSRQDVLNRLLAEHRERTAALDETFKAIQALVPRGTIVKHRKSGDVYRIWGKMRKTMFVEVQTPNAPRWTTVKLASLEIVEAGDTP